MKRVALYSSSRRPRAVARQAGSSPRARAQRNAPAPETAPTSAPARLLFLRKRILRHERIAWAAAVAALLLLLSWGPAFWVPAPHRTTQNDLAVLQAKTLPDDLSPANL